jgi:hypothetical protein
MIPVIAFAEPVKINKPVVCNDTSVVFKALTDGDFKEQPIWVGAAEDSKYTLFVNEKTGTWTVIQFDSKNACVLGEGIKSKQISNGPKI